MDALRNEIRAFLRLPEIAPAAQPVVLNEVREEGFVRRLVTFTAPDGELIQAFLFEPVGTPRAAVVALHQHNSDWALGKSEIAGLAGDPFQSFGPALARVGLRVLAPDALGFESRRGAVGPQGQMAGPALAPGAARNDWLQYYNHALFRLARGEWLISKLLGDVTAAVSSLRALAPGIPVGVFGHSFGGNLALFAAALDTRLSCLACSGALCSYRHKLSRGIPLEMALAIPGVVSHFDFDDLLRCVAPRRVLVVSAEGDPYSEDAEALVASAQPAFTATNGHLSHLRTGSGHALDRERFEAIVAWLRGRIG